MLTRAEKAAWQIWERRDSKPKRKSRKRKLVAPSVAPSVAPPKMVAPNRNASIKHVAAFAQAIRSPGFGQLVLSYSRLRRLTRRDSSIYDPAVKIPAPPRGTALDLEVDAFAREMGFALVDVRFEKPSNGPLEGTVIEVLGPRPPPCVRTPEHEASVRAKLRQVEVDEDDFQRWLRARRQSELI